jgi:HEAT repeat protein
MTRIHLLLCTTVALAGSLCCSSSCAAEAEAPDPIVELVVELLDDKDKDVRALGLEQVRTGAGGKAGTAAFAAQLPKLPPDAQVALLSALISRGDAAARPQVAGLLDADNEEAVRVAAVEALGFLGEPQDGGALLRLLSEGSDAEQAAARKALGRLPGQLVSEAIAAEIPKAEPPLQVSLIRVLTERRAFDAVPDLLAAATGNDAAVRSAAMRALGQLAKPKDVPGMVQGVLAAEQGREREDAEKAVMFVCQRIAEVEGQAEPLLAAMDALQEEQRIQLLPALGRIGGAAARKVVAAALASKDPSLHQAGLRGLCNWPDASVAAELIDLARTADDAGERLAALRALIRVAPLPDGRSDIEKLQLLQKAIGLCERDTERNLALRRASAIRIPETLRFLLPYLEEPACAQQACQSIVELAHHRGLREPNKAEFDRALDAVIRTSEDPVVVERAKRYKKGQTWT